VVHVIKHSCEIKLVIVDTIQGEGKSEVGPCLNFKTVTCNSPDVGTLQGRDGTRTSNLNLLKCKFLRSHENRPFFTWDVPRTWNLASIARLALPRTEINRLKMHFPRQDARYTLAKWLFVLALFLVLIWLSRTRTVVGRFCSGIDLKEGEGPHFVPWSRLLPPGNQSISQDGFDKTCPNVHQPETFHGKFSEILTSSMHVYNYSLTSGRG
jgi:hypothetical protein